MKNLFHINPTPFFHCSLQSKINVELVFHISDDDSKTEFTSGRLPGRVLSRHENILYTW